MVMAPVYVPVSRLVAFTETVTVAGAMPPGGLTTSQPFDEDAVNIVPEGPPIESVWFAGFAPPTVKLKASEAGVNVSTAKAGLTVNVTASAGVAPQAAAVALTDPIYVPAASPAGLADTFSVPGVVPLKGPTESQPDVLVAMAVKAVAAPPQASETVCGVAEVPPALAANASDETLNVSDEVAGEPVSVPVGELAAAALTTSVTGTVCLVLHAPTPKIVTVPWYVFAERPPGLTDTIIRLLV